MFKENGKECRYMIMINNNGIDDDGYNISDDFYIFDSTTGKTIRFDEDIISAFPESGEMSAQTDNGLYAYNNKTDIVVMTKDKKYGTTDYSANYKIEPKYDELYIAGKDLLVAKKDGKFGIINTKDETKLEFNYDGIEILDDYIIVIKGDKLGVLDRNYNVIVDFEIPYDDREEFDYELCCAESNAYYAEEDNNKNLILQTLSSSDYYYDGYATEEENDKYLYLYVIDKNGIKNRIKGYNNLYNKIDDIYNVVINKTSSIITFTLYDKNYNLQVMFSMTVTHPELIFHGYAEHINRDYYKLGIQYRDGDNYSEDTIYIDAENKEEVTLLDTQYYYFDNGYGYSTNNDKLTIYKNKDIIKEITEFKYYTYIGDYMFIAHNDYTEYLNRKIIKINFDK